VLAFDPALVLELAEAERASVLLGVPIMLIALMEHPDLTRRDPVLAALRGQLRRHRSGRAGARDRAAPRGEVQHRLRHHRVLPLITQTRLDDSVADRSGTPGQPMPNTEVMIADPVTGVPVAPGEVGELRARGYL